MCKCKREKKVRKNKARIYTKKEKTSERSEKLHTSIRRIKVCLNQEKMTSV